MAGRLLRYLPVPRAEILHSKDASEFSRKYIATARRPIYLCPLPSELFRVAPLVWLYEQCVAKGRDPLKLEFFAALKRNKKFLVDYVIFGMMDGQEVVASAKDWPENVLIAMPSEAEQISFARVDYHRRTKPTRWVTEQTANRMVETGIARWTEVGVLKYGDDLVGTCNIVKHDHVYSGPNRYAYRKPITYPKAS